MRLNDLTKAIESLGFVEIKTNNDEDQAPAGQALTSEQFDEMDLIFKQTIK